MCRQLARWRACEGAKRTRPQGWSSGPPAARGPLAPPRAWGPYSAAAWRRAASAPRLRAVPHCLHLHACHQSDAFLTLSVTAGAEQSPSCILDKAVNELQQGVWW